MPIMECQVQSRARHRSGCDLLRCGPGEGGEQARLLLGERDQGIAQLPSEQMNETLL